jgi:hypothetical protein
MTVHKKDGAPVPGSPGLQAISFNTSCEIEIAQKVMQAAGQVGKIAISELKSAAWPDPAACRCVILRAAAFRGRSAGVCWLICGQPRRSPNYNA